MPPFAFNCVFNDFESGQTISSLKAQKYNHLDNNVSVFRAAKGKNCSV
jgi:hypothetical protein